MVRTVLGEADIQAAVQYYRTLRSLSADARAAAVFGGAVAAP